MINAVYIEEETMARPARPSRSWYVLLIPATVAPLLTPVYNRVDPTLWGLPFFYWWQLMCAVLAIVSIALVHVATRERRDGWK